MNLVQEYTEYMEKEIASIKAKRKVREYDIECIIEEYEERAGIMEYDAGLPREQAEALAADLIKQKYGIDIPVIIPRQSQN